LRQFKIFSGFEGSATPKYPSSRSDDELFGFFPDMNNIGTETKLVASSSLEKTVEFQQL
jgi:hypothetical protein